MDPIWCALPTGTFWEFSRYALHENLDSRVSLMRPSRHLSGILTHRNIECAGDRGDSRVVLLTPRSHGLKSSRKSSDSMSRMSFFSFSIQPHISLIISIWTPLSSSENARAPLGSCARRTGPHHPHHRPYPQRLVQYSICLLGRPL